MANRGFEKITQYVTVDFPMPTRKTKYSAGYDFCLPVDVEIAPGEQKLLPTGIKAYMLEDEFLGMHIRSSMAVKRHLQLVNNVGIIDSDYYNNPDNEGHIMVCLRNNGDETIKLQKGECIAQGIFYKYLLADGDNYADKASRAGGFGSTTVK